jgi:HEAT repeat protein
MTPLLVHAFDGTCRAALFFFLLSGISFFDPFRDLFFTGNRIARMKAAHDVGGLIRLLSHHDPDIRYEAAEVLGEIGDPGAVESLAVLLNGEELSGVRWKAAEALGKIGKPAVEPLIAALRHTDDDVRWKAAITLGEIGDPGAIDPLVRLLSDEDRFVKSRAALALGKIGKPAVEPLIFELRQGDGNMRWGAAIALGKVQDPDSVEPLIRALTDKYENVRAEAAASLAAIGTPAIAPLIHFLKYSEKPVRLEVMNALGELHANDAIEPLVQILEKADEQERCAIASTLDAILTPSVEQLAKRLWNGTDPEDRGTHKRSDKPGINEKEDQDDGYQ